MVECRDIYIIELGIICVKIDNSLSVQGKMLTPQPPRRLYDYTYECETHGQSLCKIVK